MLRTPIRVWQPILDGDLQVQAVRAATDVADALTVPALSPTSAVRRASLASGQAGLAVLYSYLHQADPNSGHDQTATIFLDAAIDALGALPMGPALFEGFSGIAWAAVHLEERVFAPSSDDLSGDVDAALSAYVGQSAHAEDYDLINGLVGLGVYALERLPRPSAAQLLERVVDRLAERAQRVADGVTWWTSPDLLPTDDRVMSPRGYYNLGVAHGVPGAIALLAQASAAGIRPNVAGSLARQGVAWLMAQAATNPEGARFVYWIGEETSIVPSHVAWCYGDLGVAAALACAAQALHESEWLDYAAALARHTASRPLEHARAHYPGLCHGTAGIAHLFNRLYQATGDDGLRDTARDWFQRTLALRNGTAGVAGFSTQQQAGEQADDPGLLGGAAGVALSLLAAATPIPPAWDRVLLVSSAVAE